MKRKSNLIKRTKSMTVFVYDNVTQEELKEVETLRKLGWIVKPCKVKDSKKEFVIHNVDEKFDISFDDVRKEDMVNYIKKYRKDEDLKAFSIASHKNKNGEVVYVKKGGKDIPKYFHLTAKQYFFKTFFPDKWVDIEKELNDRIFKSGKKKAADEMEEELLKLL